MVIFELPVMVMMISELPVMIIMISELSVMVMVIFELVVMVMVIFELSVMLYRMLGTIYGSGKKIKKQNGYFVVSKNPSSWHR
jgi:hypothetical protein